MKKKVSLFLAVVMLLTALCCMTASADDNQCKLYGHRYGDWEVVQPASCKNKGVEVRKCEFCSDILTKTTERNPNYHPDQKLKPGSGKDGEHIMICNDCQTEIKMECVGEWKHNNETGKDDRVCVLCASTKTVECDYKLSGRGENDTHKLTCAYCGDVKSVPCSFDTSKTVKVTCTTNGYKSECCVCGNEKVIEATIAKGHTDADQNYVCDVCSEKLPKPEAEQTQPQPQQKQSKSFFDKIADFFRKIANWFKGLFK